MLASSSHVLKKLSHNMPSLLEQLHSALNQMNLDTSIPSSKLRGIQSHASIVREEIKRIQTQQLHSVQPNFQVTEIDPNFFIETTKPSNEIPDYAFLQIAGPLPEKEEKETKEEMEKFSREAQVAMEAMDKVTAHDRGAG